MKKIAFLLFILVGVANLGFAQNTLPWKKRLKLAQNFEKSGDFYQAAVYYEGVHTEKPDKDEYIYNAGNCYYLLRDYGNAVKCLEQVKDKNADFDKPGYKYALALKQTGKAEQAKDAFAAFIKSYSGSDKDAVKEAVEIEIQGCDFALNAKEFTNAAVNIEHLDAKINTNKTEFAPIPFNDNVLYFSSTISGVAKIYRSQKQGNNWGRPQTPNIFVGKMEKPHFGNGSFTEDGKRFYFTQCDLEDGKANCGIYLMTESAGGWSEPVRLPDYVNVAGSNTTHPFVATIEGKEVLYFSSDREGGRGGLDLWFCTKNADGSSNNYTLPKNLGRNINTPGDDITPFYDKAEGILYFSSNGRVSAGGLDVFKSKGDKLQWEVAQNMGFPVNSAADDLYFTVNASHGGGYFVSNRILIPQKVATTDDDVFYYGESKIVVTIGGDITDAADDSGAPLADVNVKLFLEDELIEERMIADGKYMFRLQPKEQYTIEISKEEYKVASFDVNTSQFDFSEDVTKDVALEKPESDVVEVDPIETDPVETDPIETDPVDEDLKFVIVPEEYNSRNNPYIMPESPRDPLTGEEYTGETLDLYNDIMENVAALSAQGMVYYDGPGGDLVPYLEEDVVETDPIETDPIETDPIETDPIETDPIETDPIETSEPSFKEVARVYPEGDVAPEGVMYRIQVAAVRRYKSYKYETLDEVGKQLFEEIDGGIRRVMVVPTDSDESFEGYKSKGQALNVLSHILNNTRFDRAFVIKYENGERVGEGFRGMDENEGLDENSGSGKTINEDYEGF